MFTKSLFGPDQMSFTDFLLGSNDPAGRVKIKEKRSKPILCPFDVIVHNHLTKAPVVPQALGDIIQRETLANYVRAMSIVTVS